MSVNRDDDDDDDYDNDDDEFNENMTTLYTPLLRKPQK
jgi:hypothetical protein